MRETEKCVNEYKNIDKDRQYIQIFTVYSYNFKMNKEDKITKTNKNSCSSQFNGQIFETKIKWVNEE